MSLPHPSDKQRFVEHMFDSIAGRYDLMNRLMTFGIDRGWRRQTIASLALSPGDRVVDLGCGTGDLSRDAAATGARVIGMDLSASMLALADRRDLGACFVRADAAAMPLAAGSCDAIVSGFALRNFVSVPSVLAECRRVLRPGGRVSLLEIDVPSSAPTRRAFDLYMGRIVPLLGRALSDGHAYRYLSDSLAYLPSDAELADMLVGAGFEPPRKTRLTMGAAQLVTAVRR